MKIQILMVSRERYFTEVFGNYMSSSRGELSLLSFTDYDKAQGWLDSGRNDIRAILADEAFLARCGEVRLPKIALSDYTASAPEGVSSLNIYQRKRDILEDLKALLVSLSILGQSRRQAGNTRTLAFFSTQGGGGKSTVAYITALCAAGEGKAVYLNLESGAYTAPLYGEAAPGAMDELLYAVKDRRALAPLLMNALNRNTHGVYTLPPYAGMGDRLELELDDVRFLLAEIEAMGDFGLVCLDLDAGLPPFVMGVLESCDQAVAVFSDTVAGRGKLERFMGDPSRGVLGVDERLVVVGNQCRQKYADGRFDIMLPFSQSIEKGTDLAVVLGANRELAAAGAAILAARRQPEAVL